MTGRAILDWRAGFAATPAGPRYCSRYGPPAARAIRGDVVLLPPFAEELNKVRRMIALAARAFAASGWRVHCVDLLGCGDSPGDFGEATWQSWLADLSWFIDNDTQPRAGARWLWALRGGALFVPELLAAFPDSNLLLWQPVASGKQHLQQFLRLRAAANLIGTRSTTSESPRAMLARGESVEVAGYVVQPQLAHAIEGTTLQLPQSYRGRVAWLEVDVDAPASLSPAAERILAQCRQNGMQITAEALPGLPFWATQEIAECPELLTRSLELLAATPEPERGHIGAAEDPLAPSRAATTATSVTVAANCDEQSVDVGVGSARLAAVLSAPQDKAATTAVLIIVGGPQYRIGSHRQFVSLARFLASHGAAAMRFDVRGMGDSEGPVAPFEQIEPDVAAAIDALDHACHRRAQIVVLGLCDAASAALLFAASDPRVRGLVLLNPWVRSQETLAATHLKRYYGKRLLEPEFWRKIVTGEFGWRSSLSSFARSLRSAASPRNRGGADDARFQTRMAEAWRGFRGRILLLLSGRDLTAQEFLEYSQQSAAWRGLLAMPNVTRVDLRDADHTFSTRGDQLEAERLILQWLAADGSAQS